MKYHTYGRGPVCNDYESGSCVAANSACIECGEPAVYHLKVEGDEWRREPGASDFGIPICLPCANSYREAAALAHIVGVE